MITFIIGMTILIGGYFVYSRFLARSFGEDPSRPTPVWTKADGVDFVILPPWKTFLIQFLNIAGLGPIFGAIMGAMYGPVVFIWIALGSLLAGAVHDYLTGMISIRSQGASLTKIVERELGSSVKIPFTLLTIGLMLMVGAVFISGPATILTALTGEVVSYGQWASIIFVYYFIATMFPVDKIIGRIYPIFGLSLLFMALGILIMAIYNGLPFIELTADNWKDFHPQAEQFPIFPMLFVTVACGAISGFHATQSPLMARCMTNERQGRAIFFGSMITEGALTMIWAAVGMSFFGGVTQLQEFFAANNNNAAAVVSHISHHMLGTVGGILALIGVVAAPITSADTALRAARLIISDTINYPQKKVIQRLLVSLPLFGACFVLLNIDFSIIWRYFAWLNQTLAVFSLWSITLYMARHQKHYWMSLLPALFMTMVTLSYILIASEGFQLNHTLSYTIATAVTLLLLGVFYKWLQKTHQTLNKL